MARLLIHSLYLYDQYYLDGHDDQVQESLCMKESVVRFQLSKFDSIKFAKYIWVCTLPFMSTRLCSANNETGPCREGEYTCASGKCIDVSLECDNINNCGDRSDECQLTAEAILGIALGVLLVTFVAIAIVTYVKRRRKATEFANLKRKQQVFNIHSQVHAMSEQHKTCSSCGEDTFNINTKNHMTEKALQAAAELPP
ncbi:hypothetical protein KUTeg_021553 [Tegillarca granosa]|uniref:Vitellogenin receptor n=1 Tax=Tegillarca granosa TaxID=220873 RepID=A0ABQ9E3M4_TEGGR|nr:hypothetical protein KUTeg_021553 [Tegillarca granosa]